MTGRSSAGNVREIEKRTFSRDNGRGGRACHRLAAVSGRSCRKPAASRRDKAGSCPRCRSWLRPAELAAIEDAAIKRIIARQEEIGLAAVTDGEFRRAAWHWDFLGGFEGVETTTASAGLGSRARPRPPT